MLDIALIRRDPERVRRALARRGQDPSVVDELLRSDEEYRSALGAVERAKAEKNRISAAIGQAPDRAAAASELRPQIGALAAEISTMEERARASSLVDAGSPMHLRLSQLPNLLDDSVPPGTDEADNVELRRSGQPRAFDFDPKPHWELGERLGILDFSRASKLSGSRFAVLSGAGARLARALATYFLDRAAERGYCEVAPPLLVAQSTMWATGQLSKFADDMFEDRDAGLYMIPTAEVPLTALRGNEILDASELPARYVAFTPCFRREAGAAGKDTRGLMRQHQFDKVELVWLTAPDASFAALETLTGHAEALLAELELPYRVIELCAGDTGFNAAKTYDLEVWVPSSDAYREISSCSNCTDFQARRASIRYRPDAKAKPSFVHTLNGSGLAIGRSLVAILENYQNRDGSISIPNVLRPYFGKDRIGG